MDASLGNVISSTAIVELPSFARNVATPALVPAGCHHTSAATDDRNGSVNGGRSDQANVMLDGADVNNQSNRAAFTSVLRVTPDSVEEFRTTTTNGGADTGRGSGADIVLVTKSGTNNLHGSLYEYRRGTETAANSFFNNRAGLPIAPAADQRVRRHGSAAPSRRTRRSSSSTTKAAAMPVPPASTASSRRRP